MNDYELRREMLEVFSELPDHVDPADVNDLLGVIEPAWKPCLPTTDVDLGVE